MIKTLSTLVDSQHFFNPKQLQEKSDHDKPTLLRRIMGAVLVALSIPFTLGIATGLYTYWAHRKVVYIEKQDRADLDLRVEKVFGRAVEGEEASSEQQIFEGAIRALQRGDQKALLDRVSELEPKEKNPEIKNALISALIAYDRFEEFDDVWKECGKVHIPLFEAKSAEMVTAIVDNIGGDKQVFIDHPYEDGNTALHYQQNLAVVKALAEKGAQFKFNATGQSPLHRCTDPKIAEFFIQHYGVEILEHKDSSGRIPLIAVDNPDVLRVIIEKTADIRAAVDRENHTVLHYFSTEPLKSHPELISDILSKIEDEDERNAFVNAPNFKGITPLCYPLPLPVVKALVEAGAEYRLEDSPRSPLHSCEDPAVAEYLIDQFGDEILEIVNIDGQTPLFTVQNPAVLNVFVCKGVDVNVKESKFNMTPIFFVKTVENARLLVEAGVDPKALDKINGNALFGEISPEVAKWLIDEHGLDVHQLDPGGKEAIHCINADDIEMAKILIGGRDHHYDWRENIPPVMQNLDFLKWLEAGKPTE